MSEAQSALAGASREGMVRVREAGLHGMITLRGDLGSAKVKTAVKDAAGLDVPAQRKIVSEGETAVAWMSPDELLILVPYAKVEDALAKVEKALKGEHFLAVNVSDARAVFVLEGAQVRDVMAKIAPVDMARDAFGPGDFRRTRLAQIAGAFWMPDDETVKAICFRSVAQYAFDLFSTAAETGGEVGYH
ncbi:sarcosine oxidase subunit gamma family protein [Roseovarius sp. SCSIO 43702]|uniref:sarcosine oxidase subunit gamma n=1 Tax=Roseovarius sp. SCSIO 43702 TaxID=2823043 RepID=UPI001C72A53A|nr:sarcosine oxidase subunit gamma family protein [Roseovarius sp. SCSIO 43702]QYX56425.1 sarcosine oxidase subunit gamma family protein [Roseovarius sp. SCSIO 43702]